MFSVFDLFSRKLRTHQCLAGLATAIFVCLASVIGSAQTPPCPRGLELVPRNVNNSSRQMEPAGSIPSIAESDPAAIRIETDLVIAEFEVHDKKGNRVVGLTAGDVRLEEDGVEQKIDMFAYGRSSASIGRSIILIIDYSQSQSSYIETSIAAAKVLVELLEQNDSMAIVSDDVELIVGFTNDKAKLKASLDVLGTRARDRKFGMSRQLSALFAAVDQLFSTDEKRPVVILQTDGDEFPLVSLGRNIFQFSGCPPLIDRFEELESVLDRFGTTVHSIIPGLPLDGGHQNIAMSEKGQLDLETIVRQEARIRKSALAERKSSLLDRQVRNWANNRILGARAVEKISRMTGGTTQYLGSPERAGEVYRRILDEMNQRYLIGYYPIDALRDGRKRKIKVSLKQGLNYQVRGRTSYTPGMKTAVR